MPKSSKKRKEKAADFAKARLKLGKGKQLATNAIDTSFKARSIALPQQSITVQKDASAPTTRRKLNYNDLIAHLKHHNAGARKDAIQGIRELFEGYPELVEPSLTTLITACVRLIGDEDASVRKTLLAFFSWLLPRVPSVHVIPHAPLLLLFTTSAQTHIFPEIRIDAIRFLDLLLEIIPDHVVSGWTQSGDARSGHGSRVLDGYLGLLSAGSRFGDDGGPVRATSTASVMLSPTSKGVVFESLSTFLRYVTSRNPSTTTCPTSTMSQIPTWFLASSFSSPESFESFVGLLNPSRTSSSSIKPFTWVPDASSSSEENFIGHFHLIENLDMAGESFHGLSEVADDIARLGEADSSLDAAGAHVTRVTTSLCRSLHPILISTFLDCAPNVFSPSAGSPEAEIRLILSIGQITRYLYGNLLTDHNVTKQSKEVICGDLKSILGHMAHYFPFGERSLISQDAKTEQAFQELNLTYCELSSLLALASQASKEHSDRGPKIKPRQPKKGGLTSTPASLAKQTALVSDYVVRCLRGEVTSALNPMGQRLTLATYVAILPTLWSLLNDAEVASNTIWNALLEHATQISSNSALKKASIEFIARIVLLQTEPRYQGAFCVGLGMPEDLKVQEWVVHLPRTLWELGGGNLPTTEVILLFLLRLFQRGSRLSNQETTSAVRARLVPFFTVNHRTRGDIIGPYSKLPTSSPLRRLALDVVIVLLSLEGPDEGLREAVYKAVMDTSEISYWERLARR